MRIFALVVAAMALGGAACSGSGGGGISAGNRTATVEGRAFAATATASIEYATPVAQQDVVGFVQSGFDGLTIPYTATTITSFRKMKELLAVLDDCAANRAHGAAPADEGYWPSVLGDCYFVGDATKWLYEYSGRQAFAYANQVMKRYMRQKFRQANEAGAGLTEGYWALVTDKIFTLKPSGTPVAVTPPAQ
jgi:hypothetical protein